MILKNLPGIKQSFSTPNLLLVRISKHIDTRDEILLCTNVLNYKNFIVENVKRTEGICTRYTADV